MRESSKDGRPGPQPFDLSGGDVSLDFANTYEKRLKPERVERLASYGELLRWAQESGLLSPGEAQRLLRAASARPEEARAVLGYAVELREALFAVFAAVAAGKRPGARALAVVNEGLRRAAERTELGWSRNGFQWQWAGTRDALESVLWPVLQATGRLLTSPERERVRECESEDCAWLFLDVSKNRSRRWCTMSACGNRAKARRYYQRSKRK